MMMQPADTTTDHTNGAGANGAATETTKRTQQGLRMPRVSIEDVRELVVALEALNGPASRELVFDGAGKSASGGAADARWGAMGYFGFRKKAGGGKHEITERGRALLSDDPAVVLEAKQHAIAATGFRSIIERFSGRPVNQSAVAGVMREGSDISADAADASAAMLIEVATDAQLIVEGKFKPGPIEAALNAVGETDDAQHQSPRATGRRFGRPAPQTEVPTDGPSGQQQSSEISDARSAGESGRHAGPFEVSMEIEIDAKNHSPEEIGKIVREVREALTAASD